MNFARSIGQHLSKYIWSFRHLLQSSQKKTWNRFFTSNENPSALSHHEIRHLSLVLISIHASRPQHPSTKLPVLPWTFSELFSRSTRFEFTVDPPFLCICCTLMHDKSPTFFLIRAGTAFDYPHAIAFPFLRVAWLHRYLLRWKNVEEICRNIPILIFMPNTELTLLEPLVLLITTSPWMQRNHFSLSPSGSWSLFLCSIVQS